MWKRTSKRKSSVTGHDHIHDATQPAAVTLTATQRAVPSGKAATKSTPTAYQAVATARHVTWPKNTERSVGQAIHEAHTQIRPKRDATAGTPDAMRSLYGIRVITTRKIGADSSASSRSTSAKAAQRPQLQSGACSDGTGGNGGRCARWRPDARRPAGDSSPSPVNSASLSSAAASSNGASRATADG
jgi:hypothetical protein